MKKAERQTTKPEFIASRLAYKKLPQMEAQTYRNKWKQMENGKDLSDSSRLLNAETFNKGLYFFKYFFHCTKTWEILKF